MAKQETSKIRTVLQSVAQFDLAKTPVSSSITCLSIAPLTNSTLSIYAGTDRGVLLLITLDTNPDQSSSSSIGDDNDNEKVKLVQYVSISHSAVNSIHVAARIGRGLVIADGNLFLFELETLTSVRKLTSFKGVCCVATRVCSSDCGRGSGLSFVFDEVESENWGSGSVTSVGGRIMKRLGGGIRTSGAKIKELESNVEHNDDDNSKGNCVFVVALMKKLVFVELNCKEVEGQRGSFTVLKELPCIEDVKAISWLDDSIILGSSSGYSLISCVTGQHSLIFSLPDRLATPRLKLLVKDKKALLVVDNAGIIVDSCGQPVSGTLVFHDAPDSIAELAAYVVVAKDGKMELYHRSSGACVQVLTFGVSGGGSCFLADEENGWGRFVTVGVSSKIFCYMMAPYEEQVKDLLRKKNFHEAIYLVEELVAEDVISGDLLSFVHAQVGFLLLFDLHFQEAVDHFLLSETMQPSEIFPFVVKDPNRWSLVVPRNRYWGLHPPPAPIEDVVEDGLLAIQRAGFLKKAGVDTAIDGQFLLNPPSKAVLMESAFRNIIRYLQATRSKDLNLQVKEGVDTLLMYLYRSLNRGEEMEKLASSENSCVVEELETLLEESGHLRTLAFLYANKGSDSSALSIWRVLARNYPSDLDDESAQAYNFNDTYSTRVSSNNSAAAEASKILEKSADKELILQHLGWISEISEELAVQILTSPKRVNPLSPDNVIAAIDPRKVEILQRASKKMKEKFADALTIVNTAEWLIEDQDSSDTQLHTLYALSLARSALDLMEMEKPVQQADRRSMRMANNSCVIENPLLENLVRERLQIFLHTSDLYDAHEVLELIEGSELWLEKAILYRKLGQETLVLQILALKLEDSEAAEQYCAELGRPDAYMQLLDMYLDPKNGKEPMFKAAVRLLHNHGESLDPLQVLERLSPDMPLKLASETILRMLRARLHHRHQGKIMHSLSLAVDVDARLARKEERSRSVQINDESLCDSCHARLGTKLFAMYPDDSIVCYKCFRRQGESTSVKGRNFREDRLIKPGWLVSG